MSKLFSKAAIKEMFNRPPEDPKVTLEAERRGEEVYRRAMREADEEIKRIFGSTGRDGRSRAR